MEPKLEFKNQQQWKNIEIIVQKKNRILSIMLMGKNKNLMFMLLIFCKKKKNDSSNNIVDCIETKHEETMQEIEDWLPGMKK